jgi:hypothetical protein
MDRVPGLLVGRVLALVLLATVVLAAPAAASMSAVSLLGSAEPGPGASATLTLENGNGLQVIVSVRVQAPAGKTIDAATLAGQSCDLVEGEAVCGPWAAHETLQMIVHSPQGLSPADGPFRAFASSDGQTYSGPFLIDWLLPCRCAEIGVSMRAKDAYTAPSELLPTSRKLARFGGLVSWRIKCSTGRGGCAGDITAQPPARSDIRVRIFEAIPFSGKGRFKGRTLYKPGQPKAVRFQCTSYCDIANAGSFYLEADSAHDLLPSARAGRVITLPFAMSCNGRSVKTIKLVFTESGDLDRHKSTLAK